MQTQRGYPKGKSDYMVSHLGTNTGTVAFRDLDSTLLALHAQQLSLAGF